MLIGYTRVSKADGSQVLDMQVRTKTLNNELREAFQRWYPEFQKGEKIKEAAA